MKKTLILKKKSEEKNEEISYTEKLLIDIKEAIKKAKKEDLEEINEKQEELMNRKKEIDKKEEELNNKELEIKKREEELNKKKEKIEEDEKEIKNREKQIKIKEEEINKKYEEFKNKEKEMNNEIKEIKKKYENEIENNNIIENEKIDLEKNNEKLEKKIKSIQQQLFGVLSNFEDNYDIKYDSPTLIGLNNIGATCFMNSTLQCLSQTKELTNYFLNEKNKENIINNNISLKNKNDLQLSPFYLELIKKLWNKNESKSFSPKSFMNNIEKMNPLFKAGQAGDAKDFIIFIIEQLHKELKQTIKNNTSNIKILNQYDRISAFDYFFDDFKKERSIISDLFYGFNETANECLYCKNNYNSKRSFGFICYNYGIFYCLIFPLEEVKNFMKCNTMKEDNIKNNNNIVSIYDCFSYNQKSELFSGANRNYCNICKQLYNSNYSSKIYMSPKILVIILDRGRGNKYDVKLDFNEELDITQFVQKRDSPQLIYNLYGVITHIGESGPNAHFVASCKSPIDNKWYRYNDDIVNPITNIQKEIIEFGTPYILFYQKNNK